MQPIKVPEVGESITEGLLVEWHIKDGAYVELDTPLFDVETDKVTVTVNAEAAGSVKIEVGEGTDVEIGQVVGKLDTAATKPDNGAKPAAKKPAESRKEEVAATTTAKAQETKTGAAATTATQPLPAGDSRTAVADSPKAKAPSEADGRGLPETAVSPTVRAFIRANGLDISDIEGTGPLGRITLEDAQRALKARETGDTATAAATAAAPAGPKQTRKKMTPIRKRIAERLVEAKNTTAMLTTFNEVDMSKVMALRAQYKDHFEKKYGIKLGFMSFFVKAAIDALKTVPQVNAIIDETDIVQNHYYDIGMAVSTEKGLVVPVIRDADQLSFAEVELAIHDLARRARDRKLDLSDLSGGVFSITNGGIFGSMLSTPILNPPQSAILGMHAIKKRAMVIDENTPNERIEARPMMYLAMSYDHRLIDGAEAVTFLKRICECIGDPQRLLLEV